MAAEILKLSDVENWYYTVTVRKNYVMINLVMNISFCNQLLAPKFLLNPQIHSLGLTDPRKSLIKILSYLILFYRQVCVFSFKKDLIFEYVTFPTQSNLSYELLKNRVLKWFQTFLHINVNNF